MHLADTLASDPSLAAAALRLRREPGHPFPILMAKFKLTWHCNLRCGTCFLWQRALESTGATSLPEQLVLDTLSALKAQGLRKVHFSGGEVLVYPGFRRIVAHARDLDLQVNFTTNGVLMDKEWARFFLSARVHGINFSIDGATAEEHDRLRGLKGAWKATWKGLEILRRQIERKGRGPVISINTLVSRHNIHQMNALHQLLVARGLQHWRLLPVDSPDPRHRPTEEQWCALAAELPDFHALLTRMPLCWQDDKEAKSAHRAGRGRYAGDFYEDHICFAPWFNLFVDANGAVYPCCMGKNHMQTYGNLLQTPLEALFVSRARLEVQASMASGQPYEICGTCDDFLEENEAFEKLYNIKRL